jgi:hypothetical protein
MPGMPDRAPDVLVRVAPRLLRDALCVVLEAEGLAVTACPVKERRTSARPPRRYDLAIVHDGPPADAACERVIRVDQHGSVLSSSGSPVGEAGVEALLEAVWRALDEAGAPPPEGG